MAGTRNRNGFYTGHMLRGGARDQYAALRPQGRVKIELCHGGVGLRPWLVSCEITAGENVSVTDAAFEFLDDARKEFRRLVRKHS